MSNKDLPFFREQLEAILKKYPTRFNLYAEKAIIANTRRFKNAFSWNPGFKEYFAVKATPNPFLLKILHKEGFGTDCSSLTELMLSEKCGIIGEDIMFS